MSHRPAAFLAAAAAILLATPGHAAAREHAPGPWVTVTVGLPVPPPWVIATLPPPTPRVRVSPAVYYGWLHPRFAPPPRLARMHGGGYGRGHGNGWGHAPDTDD